MKGIICMLLSVLLFCLLICAAELPPAALPARLLPDMDTDLLRRRSARAPVRVVEPDLPRHAGQARRHRARHLCMARADLAAGDIPCKYLKRSP